MIFLEVQYMVTSIEHMVICLIFKSILFPNMNSNLIFMCL